MADRKRDLAPLSGALFVVLVIVAFVGLGGNTPDGDRSGQKVVAYYSDHDSREIAAALVLSLAAVALMFFASTLRDRLSVAATGPSALPGFAFAGGIVSATGFLVAATVHFALADYASDIAPSAAQAINAIDSDFFLPFTSGLAALVLAVSLLAIRARVLIPAWMGWIGVLLFVVFFTPVGFIAFGLSGIWIIALSVILSRRGGTVAADPRPAAPAGTA
jgi:hypothetical protein